MQLFSRELHLRRHMRPIVHTCLAVPLPPGVVEIPFPPGLAVSPLLGRTGALLDGAAVILLGGGEAARPFEAECEGLVANIKDAPKTMINAESSTLLCMTDLSHEAPWP
jgi:hypothetical protein